MLVGALTPRELEQYFARIAYRGPTTPTLAVLHALTAAHSQAIPFENLDPLLGRGVELSEGAVFDKLVSRRRGGYCFEQNGLFLRVLESLGFEVTPLSARVRIDRPRQMIPARTHMFLRVKLGGERWLTDVGVGGLSLTAALLFQPELEQATPHERRRVTVEDGRYFHQAWLGQGWADVYEFTGEPMPLIDREVANWYTSTHPQSHLRQALLVARAAPDGGRITLMNHELKLRGRDGPAEGQVLSSQAQLRSVLLERFGLRLEPEVCIPVPGLPALASAPVRAMTLGPRRARLATTIGSIMSGERTVRSTVARGLNSP